MGDREDGCREQVEVGRKKRKAEDLLLLMHANVLEAEKKKSVPTTSVVMDALPGSRSSSPRGSAKSTSCSPARSKDGSRYSRSRSRSKSRSKSRSRSHRSSRRHNSRSRSRSHRRRSRSRSRSWEDRRHRSHSRSPMSNRRRHTGNRANPDPNNCLGVFGLSLYTTERDLREVFSKYGPLSGVNIVCDQQSRRSRGFAFVYFENSEDSKEAKEHANGMELDGRRIRVDFSITKRAHTPTPGIYMGRPTYGGGSSTSGGSNSGGSSRRTSRDCDRGYDRSYDRDYDRYDDREYRSYRRRSPSPYYSRGYRSRSQSRSYSPRHY
ncbi:transformer-2 protein homolog alpha-like isoform X2 [Anoplopoma fimbria]|uniref:transformer-2 protein homolog alpha-like isoform X2 n=1 Tax=Anoplopoma fimbria TaxID=229290 RepID=UPI0023ED300D|nr:transformer-2 protein homolog alpha-like isoform X2 [Anoplopoma fimbria]